MQKKGCKINDMTTIPPPATPLATLTPLFPDPPQQAAGNGKQEECKTAAGAGRENSDGHLTARYWG